MSISKYKVYTQPICPAASVISGEKYRFSILTPSLIRMEYSEQGKFEDRATQSVWFRDFETPDFHKEEKEEELAIYTGALELHYNKKAFSKNGLSIKINGLRDGNNSTWHYGEDSIDLLGTARTLDHADGHRVIDTSSYKRGENPMKKDYNGDVPMERGILSRLGYSFIDDSKSMIMEENGWISEREPGIIDFYFFGYGHRYLEALKDFYHLCGKTPLLPRYAFGNWWSRYYRYTEESYKTLMSRFEKEKIPFSVSVVDMDWHLVDDVDPKYGTGWTGYTWNPEFFPDPKGFMAWLHAHNLRITLNVHPADGVRAFEKLYPQVAEAMGIDPKSELPVTCDLTNPKYIETYFDKLHHPLEEEGVDFWWIDWQQGGVTKKPGLDPLWMLNHYHYQDSTWKGKRAITFSRYAGVGSHRYPIGFSGDTIINWDSLKFQPYFTSTASNIGYGWWSHDIGGHMLGKSDEELTARWTELGVFSPINRLHSSNNPFSGKEPWKYGIETRTIMEKFLRLRHELVPYLYSMNHRAHYEDLPLIWPMYYAEPEINDTYDVPNEYYFGSELIVSAITSPHDPVVMSGEADTWLPEGLWADFFNGRVYDGGRRISLWRKMEEYPVLMKAGAIVPMKDLTVFDNGTENPKAMAVRVFPAASGKFMLWEDPGDTAEPKEADWAFTQLTIDVEKSVFTIVPAKGNTAVLPEKRSWKVTFMAVEKADAEVRVCGKEGEDVSDCTCQTSYDERSGALTVCIPETSIQSEIRITLAAGCTLRQNPVLDQCFEILEHASMEYETKRAIYDLLQKNPRHPEARLAAMKLEDSIYRALVEVISAR